MMLNNFKNFLKEKEYSPTYNEGTIISKGEMLDYILNNYLSNHTGIFDYNEAKEIAYSSDLWELTRVDLNKFNWVCDPDYKNKSINKYPIVISYDGEYEVLDGKHRIGMLKAQGKMYVLAWMGKV